MLRFRGKAFTLLETMIALFILCLSVSLLETEMQLIRHQTNYVTRDDTLQWHLAMAELNQMMRHAQLVDVQTTKIKIQIDHQNYSLAPYSNNQGTMLRITGITSGHMPVLLDLKTVEFSYDEQNQNLLLKIQTIHNQHFEHSWTIAREEQQNEH